MDYKIKKGSKLKGVISLFGDKSISHRALLFSSLAQGSTTIKNLSPGQDVQSTGHCLQQLGIKMISDSASLIVKGQGLYGLQPSPTPLDAGNSGTTVRLLSGILAAQHFNSVITGDKYLSRRPMDRIIIPLKKMGADIKGKDNKYLPLEIQGRPLLGLHYYSPLASAQVKSCVLLAGLYAQGETSVTEPFASRDHTEKMLSSLGVPLKKNGTTSTIQGVKKLKAAEITIPGDISSAAFFLTAALLLNNSELTLTNIGINPTRTGIITALKKMGAEISCKNQKDFNGEPVADLTVKTQRLKAAVIKNPLIPKIIDEIPILAIAATQAQGETKILDAGELRVKETDRIHALYVNLKSMGARVTEVKDGLVIQGPTELIGTKIETFGDHRIAMAFTVAGLIAQGSTTIKNSECAEISFPGFYKTLESVYV